MTATSRWYSYPPAGGPDELAAAALVATLLEEPGAVALWETWCEPGSVPQYIAVVTAPDPAPVSARLVRAVHGPDPPRVEVLVDGEPVPRQAQRALESAILLWSAELVPAFRFAGVGDGIGADGFPFFTPDHPVVPVQLRPAVLAHLLAAPIVLATSATDADVVERERGQVVPLTLRTDGAWIFSDALGYYLHHYGLAPERGLLDRVGRAGPPGRVAVHQALQVLRGRA
ncbi:hypothetical protein [Lentzea cavernae]|uniref:Uncharacterized protein n=1 Tax=Lentzea cavernae TaxID=2020703 RepID=A0ABQ3MRN9_9PSEU|nr:hypothetical protein [Lentzea cavernae]GHH56532.1 hypothetical protein GCM10017774_74770 [Lentzea cavernae]